MTIHGITIESAPNRNKEQSATVKQNGKFAGIAKKKTRSRRPGQQRSLVNPPDVPSDSDDKPQEQASLYNGHGEAEVKDYQPKINECNASWIYPPRSQGFTMQP